MVMSLVRSDALAVGEEQLALYQDELTNHLEEQDEVETYLKNSFRDRLHHVYKLAFHRKRLSDAGYDPITGTTARGDVDAATIQRHVSWLNGIALYFNEVDTERAEKGADWQRLKFELPYILRDIKEAEERIETVKGMTEWELMEEARIAREIAEAHERMMRAAAEASARCVDPGEFTLWDLWSTDDEMDEEEATQKEEKGEEEKEKEENQSTGNTTEFSN
ncbi:uncharacterized protein LAJ45_03578 [Morchella importuna]|uniref:uncharacterized protein n=1 Tax=Morchella importuna TaxID=1174673 RepID=UPI001E8CECBB|nr:uncharacterized protein LAJ45_03578 [Morchella importuna]KAH8152152.1 hypothetical protein LAJ45_03578 [Morchella importuna]